MLLDGHFDREAAISCKYIVASIVQGAESMDCMLDNFLAWQAKVAKACNGQGHWCDAADPRSGYPIASSRGQRWNEVRAAQALLGYKIVAEDEACPLLSHPQHGMRNAHDPVTSDWPPEAHHYYVLQ